MYSQGNKWKFWLCFWLTASIAIKCDKFMNDQGVKLRLERAKCKCAPAFCSVERNVKLVSRDRADFNALLKLLKPLNYNEYHLRTYYKHSNNEYRPMLLDLKDEFCKSYGNGNHSMLTPLGIILTALGNTSNFNQPCPWLPGDYYVKGFNFAIKHWPGFIPEGRHIINITGYSQPNVFLANFEIYFQVTNHGILDLRVG